MKEYITSTSINAAPEAVWAILASGPGYAEWNPEIVKVEGELGPGERVVAHVRLGDGAIRKVAQRVTAFDVPHLMEWTGGLPLGLFVGRRRFTLDATADGTRFTMHLAMSGPLAALILRSVGDRQPEIDTFSVALKRQAEQPE